ncbi:MAG TPA: hypothetical protein VHA78_01605 [Candidatus Peribacteraceae bacterium]|nr:hypothetical protein [Candidatus Peribacteraceae bacterium]
MTQFSSLLRPERQIRVLTVAVSAAIGLYLLVAFVAEPLRGLAASSDSETAVVQVTLAAGLGLSCDANGDNKAGSGETLSLGTITYTGDTGAYSSSRAVKCWITTNNQTGYTLGWKVASGSGGTATGYLANQFNDLIAPFGTGSTSNNTATWSVASNDSRWGGRVSSTSSGADVAPMLWGTDASSEKWARVTTGSTLTIRASSTHAQSGSGDVIRIGFRAAVGATKAQPTGTYKATVTFTAATQ